MPLSINDKVISRKDLCEKYGIDYEKLAKRPEFESKKSFIDRANNGKKQHSAGSSVLARILIEDSDMKPVEIRYYISRKKDKDGDYEYNPYRVDFAGEGMVLGEDLDLAVFAYLHPTNELSPFFKAGTKASFEFVDATKRAQKKVNDIDALGEAIVHAKTINGQNARILAKGLGIPAIEPMNDLEVTAALMNYAHTNPSLYLQKKGQRITMVEGQIQHFIDKGIFKMERIGDVRKWVWTAGQRTGEVIIDIYNATLNANEALKNHILGDLNNYLFLLNNMNDSISAREKAIRDLDEIPDETGQMVGNNLPEHLRKIGTGGRLPTNFNEGLEYLTGKLGKRPSNKQIAALYKGVNDGSIGDENVAEWIDENCRIVAEA